MSSVGPGESRTLGCESSSSEPSSFYHSDEYFYPVQRIIKGRSPEGDTVEIGILMQLVPTWSGRLKRCTHEFAVWPKNVDRPSFEMELGNECAVNQIAYVN